MTSTLRVFVSSVQKELEDERLIVQNLVNTDSFLSAHCTPVLYECEPASPEKAYEGCLSALDACHVYLLIVRVQYGTRVEGLSITHTEYRRARERGLPLLAFIKGDLGVKREAGTEAFLREIDADGFKYKRFANVIERTVCATHAKIPRYADGCFLHMDSLRLSKGQIEALLACAEKVEAASNAAGHPFGTVDDLMEHGDQPHLALLFGVTDALIASLVANGGRFRVLGPTRNAFVSAENRYRIRRLGNLIREVRWIVPSTRTTRNIDLRSRTSGASTGCGAEISTNGQGDTGKWSSARGTSPSPCRSRSTA